MLPAALGAFVNGVGSADGLLPLVAVGASPEMAIERCYASPAVIGVGTGPQQPPRCTGPSGDAASRQGRIRYVRWGRTTPDASVCASAINNELKATGNGGYFGIVLESDAGLGSPDLALLHHLAPTRVTVLDDVGAAAKGAAGEAAFPAGEGEGSAKQQQGPLAQLLERTGFARLKQRATYTLRGEARVATVWRHAARDAEWSDRVSALQGLCDVQQNLSANELRIVSEWLSKFVATHRASCTTGGLSGDESAALISTKLPAVPRPLPTLREQTTLYAHRLPLALSNPDWCIVCVGATSQRLADVVVKCQIRALQRLPRRPWYRPLPPDADDDAALMQADDEALITAVREDLRLQIAKVKRGEEALAQQSLLAASARSRGGGGGGGGRAVSRSPVRPSAGARTRTPPRPNGSPASSAPGSPRRAASTPPASPRRGRTLGGSGMAGSAVDPLPEDTHDDVTARPRRPLAFSEHVMFMAADSNRVTDGIVRACGAAVGALRPNAQSVTGLHVKTGAASPDTIPGGVDDEPSDDFASPPRGPHAPVPEASVGTLRDVWLRFLYGLARGELDTPAELSAALPPDCRFAAAGEQQHAPQFVCLPVGAFKDIQRMWVEGALPMANGGLAFVLDQVVVAARRALVVAPSSGGAGGAADKDAGAVAGDAVDPDDLDSVPPPPALADHDHAAVLNGPLVVRLVPGNSSTGAAGDGGWSPLALAKSASSFMSSGVAEEDDDADAPPTEAPALRFDAVPVWLPSARPVVDVRTQAAGGGTSQAALDLIAERSFAKRRVNALTAWPPSVLRRACIPFGFQRNATRHLTRFELTDAHYLQLIEDDVFRGAGSLRAVLISNAPFLRRIGNSFAADCPVLDKVTVEHCKRLESIGNNYGARSGTLRVLRFERCSVTSVGGGFASDLGRLPGKARRLEVIGCPGISPPPRPSPASGGGAITREEWARVVAISSAGGSEDASNTWRPFEQQGAGLFRGTLSVTVAFQLLDHDTKRTKRGGSPPNAAKPLMMGASSMGAGAENDFTEWRSPM